MFEYLEMPEPNGWPTVSGRLENKTNAGIGLRSVTKSATNKWTKAAMHTCPEKLTGAPARVSFSSYKGISVPRTWFVLRGGTDDPEERRACRGVRNALVGIKNPGGSEGY